MAELQKGTNSLVATVQDTREQTQQAQAEAQDLLKWAPNSGSRLEGTWRGHVGVDMEWDKCQSQNRDGVGGLGLRSKFRTGVRC